MQNHWGRDDQLHLVTLWGKWWVIQMPVINNCCEQFELTVAKAAKFKMGYHWKQKEHLISTPSQELDLTGFHWVTKSLVGCGTKTVYLLKCGSSTICADQPAHLHSFLRAFDAYLQHGVLLFKTFETQQIFWSDVQADILVHWVLVSADTVFDIQVHYLFTGNAQTCIFS